MIGHQIYSKLGIFPLGHHFPCWVTIMTLHNQNAPPPTGSQWNFLSHVKKVNLLMSSIRLIVIRSMNIRSNEFISQY